MKRLCELQLELNQVLSGPLSDEAISKQREIQFQIENLLEQEELYWVQPVRVNWMKHGDQIKDFFHRSALARSVKAASTDEYNPARRRTYTSTSVELHTRSKQLAPWQVDRFS
jgi:hypothetical protein